MLAYPWIIFKMSLNLSTISSQILDDQIDFFWKIALLHPVGKSTKTHSEYSNSFSPKEFRITISNIFKTLIKNLSQCKDKALFLSQDKEFVRITVRIANDIS